MGEEYLGISLDNPAIGLLVMADAEMAYTEQELGVALVQLRRAADNVERALKGEGILSSRGEVGGIGPEVDRLCILLIEQGKQRARIRQMAEKIEKERASE